MHYILLILLPCFLSVTSSNAASLDDYAKYAYNSTYYVEKVRYYDEYGRPVPPPRHNVDRRPAPPPPPRHKVDRRPAPAPTYNVDVRPAPPPPPKR